MMMAAASGDAEIVNFLLNKIRENEEQKDQRVIVSIFLTASRDGYSNGGGSRGL